MGKKDWGVRAWNHIRELETRLNTITKLRFTGSGIHEKLGIAESMIEKSAHNPKEKQNFQKEVNSINLILEKYEKELGLVTKKDIKRHRQPKERANPMFHHEPSTKTPVTTFRELKRSEAGLVKIDEGDLKFEMEAEVVLSRKAYNKIMTWTRLMSLEITGLGICSQKGKTIYVEDMFLFRQIVSGAQCEMEDALAVCEMMDEIAKQGYNPSDLKCWWHSHNSMGTSPSGTDIATAKKYANNEYLVCLISNHDGEFNCKINIFKPFDIVLTEVPLFLEDEVISQEFIDERKKEIELYCKEESASRVIEGFNPSNGLYRQNWDSDYARGVHEVQDQYEHYARGWERFDNDLLERDVPQVSFLEEAMKHEDFTEVGIDFYFDSKTGLYKMYDPVSAIEIQEEDLPQYGILNYNQILREEQAKGIVNATQPS